MTLLNTHPIKKSDLGFHGNLFGGKLLAWLDASAASYAMELCDTPRMVTVLIDKCEFKKPAKESQIIKLYLEARAHSVYSGKQTTILNTYITFVRIDEIGDPIPISDRVKDKIESLLA
jgi:acyl-CoA thioesterase YciA